MRVVAQATEPPGCCVLSGRADGPLMQLDRPIGPEAANGGTAYVRLDVIRELARAIGWAPAHEIPEEAPQSELEAMEARAEAAEQAHEELLAAVGTTLKHGAVVRKSRIELRHPYDRSGRRRRPNQGQKPKS